MSSSLWASLAPVPFRNITGYLFESADAITLPAVWPSLLAVNFFVDTNVRGLNKVFRAAANSAALRRLIQWCQPLGLRMSRVLGSESGGLAYEVEDAGGLVVRLALTSDHDGYITPVVPAVLVAQSLAQGKRTQKHKVYRRSLSRCRRLGKSTVAGESNDQLLDGTEDGAVTSTEETC